MSFFVLLLGLNEKIEKKKEREREKEKIYHIITMMMFFFTRNIRQGIHKTAKRSALMD